MNKKIIVITTTIIVIAIAAALVLIFWEKPNVEKIPQIPGTVIQNESIKDNSNFGI